MSPGRQLRFTQIPGVSPRFSSFADSSRKRAVSHGGDLSLRKRKTARPIDPKQAIHVVLRSSKARGPWSMLHPKHCRHIHAFSIARARHCGVRIYHYANAGNHLHLLVKTRTKVGFQRFLRETCGGIAQLVTGAQKGRALPHGFWDHLAFTRIVRLGRDFASLQSYLMKNLFEASGIAAKPIRGDPEEALDPALNPIFRSSICKS